MSSRSAWSTAFAVAALGLGALFTGRGAEAQTLKMAHIYTPGNIWYEAAAAYGKAVEERSGGKIKFQIAHSGSTGDWPQSIDALLIGTNDIVLQSVGTLDRYTLADLVHNREKLASILRLHPRAA